MNQKLVQAEIVERCLESAKNRIPTVKTMSLIPYEANFSIPELVQISTSNIVSDSRCNFDARLFEQSFKSAVKGTL